VWPQVRDRRPFVAVFTGLIALMWVSLWVWGHSPYARFLNHEKLGHLHGRPEMLLFVAGWTLMIVAMMLPTSLPLVALFHSFVRKRPQRAQLVGLVVGGYLVVWTSFGLLVHVTDHDLHHAVSGSAWLQAKAWALGAGIVIVAGLYQFAPLKHRCLEKCRSPLAFIMENWHGGRSGRDAFRLGVHHGLFCLGCCWSLMLLMFAVGIGNIAWMLALGAVMAIEKNAAWGRRLSAPLGALLVGWGLVLAVSGTWITPSGAG